MKIRKPGNALRISWFLLSLFNRFSDFRFLNPRRKWREVPQSRHCVTLNCAPQCGQTPCVRNMSNACPHLPQRQSAPSGGAVLQDGQAKPSRRGILAILASARACFRPPQQFIRMNAAMMPNQMRSGAKNRRSKINAGHADETDDAGRQQAVRAAKRKPQQRTQNLSAVERIDRHQVEDQQARG